MPGYETLDMIADSFIPLLACISLLLIAARVFKAQWRPAGLGLAAFTAVALVAYGLMFIDRQLNIWPAFGLDYSTHTATSLGLVILLSFDVRRLMIAWYGSLICYLILMLYQHYHSLADIVTTGVVTGIPFWLIISYLYRAKPGNAALADR